MSALLIGACLETFDPLPARGCELLADLTWPRPSVRYWLKGHQALEHADRCGACHESESSTRHPAEHPFTPDYAWPQLDNDMIAMDAAGFDIYVNLMWMPPCVTGGQPSLMPYTDGCAVYNDPRDGSKGWRYADRCGWVDANMRSAVPCGKGTDDTRHVPPSPHTMPDGTVIDLGFGNQILEKHPFTPEKPYCLNPNVPAASASMVRAFAVAFTQRYGLASSEHYCAGWRWSGAWNEPDGPWYWPKMYRPANDNWQWAYDALGVEIIDPWTEGVRSVRPDMVFVGNEGASPGALHFGFASERASGKHRYDIADHHLDLGFGSYPDTTIARLAEFRTTLDRVAPTLPRWITEVDDDAAGHLPDWYATMNKRTDGYERAFLYPHDDGWFKPGTWKSGQPEPNDYYYAMRRAVRAAFPARRRSVRA